ncbi:hypothetical protein G6F62_012244 [Rhizopus arrhizus]|nr:hypothetical protein G6F32_013242 [Rhizopus arrhizus]KAG1318640.1 hypothetical protein G6F62_012244 [Rhizopus arrhizus]
MVTTEERVQKLTDLQQSRLIKCLQFVQHPTSAAIARDFVRQQWLIPEQAQPYIDNTYTKPPPTASDSSDKDQAMQDVAATTSPAGTAPTQGFSSFADDARPINNHDTHSSDFTNFKLCSLNCRSLTKPSQPETSQSFIRFLRSQSLDILSLQETHAHDIPTQTALNLQFQAKSASWTKYCGVVSLNPQVVLTPFLITRDQRMIICHIKHSNDLFTPITLVNIYAPAQPQLRRQFYAEILQFPYLRSLFDRHTDQEEVSLSDVHHTIITGDFNYHLCDI